MCIHLSTPLQSQATTTQWCSCWIPGTSTRYDFIFRRFSEEASMMHIVRSIRQLHWLDQYMMSSTFCAHATSAQAARPVERQNYIPKERKRKIRVMHRVPVIQQCQIEIQTQKERVREEGKETVATHMSAKCSQNRRAEHRDNGVQGRNTSMDLRRIIELGSNTQAYYYIFLLLQVTKFHIILIFNLFFKNGLKPVPMHQNDAHNLCQYVSNFLNLIESGRFHKRSKMT